VVSLATESFKLVHQPTDVLQVSWLIEFVFDVLTNYRFRMAFKAYRTERRQGRQRERMFAETQVALARQRADQIRTERLDYFVDPPRRSS
jgi:hypothetical protein